MANRKQRASIRGRGSMSMALGAADPRQRRNPQAGTRGEDYKPPLTVEASKSVNGRPLRRLAIDLGEDFDVSARGELSLSTSASRLNVRLISATTTVTDDDDVLVATQSPLTVNLPPAAESRGRVIEIIRAHITAGALTIDPFGSETINNSPTILIQSSYDARTCISDGSEWWVM